MKTSRLARLLILSVFAIGLLVVAPARTIADDADAKTTEVKVKDITLIVPATWKEEEPESRLRVAQFKIPAAEGDKEDAELAVFSFGASGIEDNIKRWINQFQPEGRKVAISSGEAKQGKYVFVNLSGTYNKPVGPPVLGKTEATPGSRVLAVILAAPEKGVYFFKLTGLDKTVAAQTDALRKSFGGDASKERELKLDE